jgi:hypothetical protein
MAEKNHTARSRSSKNNPPHPRGRASGPHTEARALARFENTQVFSKRHPGSPSPARGEVSSELGPRLREDDISRSDKDSSSSLSSRLPHNPTARFPISDRIEEERGRLMTAETLLHCAVVAMEEGDCEGEADAPHYPSVIDQAREIMNRSIRELEVVALDASVGAQGKYGVKEEAAEYVH